MSLTCVFYCKFFFLFITIRQSSENWTKYNIFLNDLTSTMWDCFLFFLNYNVEAHGVMKMSKDYFQAKWSISRQIVSVPKQFKCRNNERWTSFISVRLKLCLKIGIYEILYILKLIWVVCILTWQTSSGNHENHISIRIFWPQIDSFDLLIKV